MKENVRLPKKQFYIISVCLGLVIFFLSIEVMMKVKDVLLYNKWFLKASAEGLGASYEDAFGIYVSLNLGGFFLKTSIPMALGVYTYFAYVKMRINKLFVFIWTILLIGAAAFVAMEMNFASVFYYIELALYAVLIIVILSLVNLFDRGNDIAGR
ncbi:MAG: hypothetical protein JXB33_03215 [Clostridia bacterium]|nr:hypothetical protein [Clostridia bacterium]